MSPEKQLTRVNCPHCGKEVTWSPESRWRPFCSEKCKLIDLGEWFDENRKIPEQQEPAKPFPKADESSDY